MKIHSGPLRSVLDRVIKQKPILGLCQMRYKMAQKRDSLGLEAFSTGQAQRPKGKADKLKTQIPKGRTGMTLM